MLHRWVRTMSTTVGRGGHRLGQIVKTLLRPVRTTAALTSAAALDAVRPRSELVAENALLRLQILVLARAAPPRPRLFREDRLLLVLLARVNTPGATPFISSNPIPSCTGIAICSPSSGDAAPDGRRGPQGWARRSSS
jgi:hypothetical protein